MIMYLFYIYNVRLTLSKRKKRGESVTIQYSFSKINATITFQEVIKLKENFKISISLYPLRFIIHV